MTKPNENGKTGAPAAASKDAPKAEPFNPWNELKVGDWVLWQTDPTEGYFVCSIVSVSNDRKTLSLRWKLWPSYPLVKAPRVSVGLIQVIK